MSEPTTAELIARVLLTSQVKLDHEGGFIDEIGSAILRAIRLTNKRLDALLAHHADLERRRREELWRHIVDIKGRLARLEATNNPGANPMTELTTAELLERMEQWVDGRMSHQNVYGHLGPEIVAILDAQEVVKLSAAIQAIAALESTKEKS